MVDRDGYEVDVRRWLDGVEAPPPRLDVSRILRAGRARVRRRRYLAAGGTAAAALAVAVAVPATVQVWRPAGGGPSPADQPPAALASPSSAMPLATLECEVLKLPVPDGIPGGFVDIQAVDPAGRYVVGIGGRAPEAEGPPLVLWRDGEPALIRGTGGEASAEAVNADGAVVGHTWDGERTYGWVYRDGTVTELPLPEGGYRAAFARAINETGDVVGDTVGTGPVRRGAVVVWPADAPDQPRVFMAPGFRGVSAVGITDDGRVVGSARDGTGGYVWEPGGTVRRLPLPDGADRGQVTAARGDWAVGSVTVPVSEDPATPSPAASPPRSPAGSPTPGPAGSLPPNAASQQFVVVPIRWDLRTGASETFDAARYGGRSEAVAVSADGDLLVGAVEPIVVRNGRPYVLPGAVKGAGVPRPVAVSDDGTVLAGRILSEVDGAPQPRGVPVVWHC